jgi:hypothetical protein
MATVADPAAKAVQAGGEHPWISRRLAPPGARTTRTRSTTCSRSRASSEAALDVRAREITQEMELAAARALAAVVKADELEADRIIPSVFDNAVAPAVAHAVAVAAERAGVAVARRASEQPSLRAASLRGSTPRRCRSTATGIQHETRVDSGRFGA